MATALRQWVPDRRIVRFEHDTWHDIADNSDVLAQQVARIRANDVTFIAHSRGGLVARRAAEKLTSQGWAGGRVIALGTPFAGTELVDQARGGLLGATATFGALRVFVGGALDPISRLASLMFRKLPIGIEQMGPRSSFITGYPGPRDTAHVFAFAGNVDAEGSVEVRGIAGSALHGLARAGYGRRGDPGDLVVSVASAKAGAAANQAHTVASDHFSYFAQKEVEDHIRQLAAGSPLVEPPGDDEA
jgi:hypothetical protein